MHLRYLYFYFLYDFTNHRDFKGLKYGIQACKQVGFHRGRYVTMLSNRWLNRGFVLGCLHVNHMVETVLRQVLIVIQDVP